MASSARHQARQIEGDARRNDQDDDHGDDESCCKVCLKIETSRLYGRHFDDKWALVVMKLGKQKCSSKMHMYPTQTIPGQVIFPALNVMHLRHGMKLVSTYAAHFGSEPQFTNYTRDFQGCLDYIFVSKHNVQVLHALQMPRAHDTVTHSAQPQTHKEFMRDDTVDKQEEQGEQGELEEGDGNRDHLSAFLPDCSHPSDHLPLRCVLQLL